MHLHGVNVSLTIVVISSVIRFRGSTPEVLIAIMVLRVSLEHFRL